jgi:hypothetical protein
MKGRYCLLGLDGKILTRYVKLGDALAADGYAPGMLLARDDGAAGLMPIFKWDEEDHVWFDLFPETPGGPRGNAGRPLGMKNKKGAPKSDWVQYGSNLPVELNDWLNMMKKKGYAKNKLIIQGLHLLRKQLSENIIEVEK